MNPPTLVELRTAVAALHQRRKDSATVYLATHSNCTSTEAYDLVLAELNLTRQLNAKLEEELKLKLPSAQFLNWLKALDFIDHDQLPELSEHEWHNFTSNPTHYTIRANAEQQAAILREIAKSQHPTATQEPKSC